MTEPQAKRSRADDNGTVEVPAQIKAWTHQLTAYVESLSHDQLKSLVLEAAKTHSDVFRGVGDFCIANKAAERIKVAAERAKVLTFDHLVENVSYNLHVKYNNLSGSKQFDKAGKVSSDVDRTIKSIARQAGTTSASAGTRSNGLEALCNVGESFLNVGDTLASEVRKDHQYGDTLVGGMKKIVKAMMNEEREAMRWVTLMGNRTDSEFAKRLMELKEEADGYCCFEGLDGVLCMLEEKKKADDNVVVEDVDEEIDQGEGDDEGDDDEDDDDDDDDDDDEGDDDEDDDDEEDDGEDEEESD